MKPATYTGANALGLSRYASPQHSVASEASLPAIASHDSIVATTEQIATACHTNDNGKAPCNTAAKLTIAKEYALKPEVDSHVARLSSTVSTTVANTRKLLTLVRASLQKDSVTDTKAIDGLWAELEQLVEAASDVKAAMPVSLGKQGNHMSLYHSSMPDETIRDPQEVDIQPKKIHIQHDFLLEQQEAVQDDKAQTTVKLQELRELKERVSRLTLERANFRTDLDLYKQLLEKEQVTKAGEIEKISTLETEVGALRASKTQLLEEANALGNTLHDLREKIRLGQQHSNDTLELKVKADQLAKEVESNRTLRETIASYKATEETLKMQIGSLRQKNLAAQEKYSQQAVEHGLAFSNLREQAKKLDALSIDMDRLQEENHGLKQDVARLSKLETQNKDLSQAKSALATQIIKLSAEADAAKKEGIRVKMDCGGLKRNLVELEKTIEDLESKNSDLIAEKDKYETIKEEMQSYKSEQKKLNSVIQDVPSSAIAPAGDEYCLGDRDRPGLQDVLIELEKKNTNLKTSLADWVELAKV